LDLSDFEQWPICAGETRHFYRYAPNGAAWRRLSLATLNTVFGSPFLGSNQVRALCCAVHEMRHPTGDFIEYFESLVAAQGLEPRTRGL